MAKLSFPWLTNDTSFVPAEGGGWSFESSHGWGRVKVQKDLFFFKFRCRTEINYLSVSPFNISWPRFGELQSIIDLRICVQSRWTQGEPVYWCLIAPRHCVSAQMCSQPTCGSDPLSTSSFTPCVPETLIHFLWIPFISPRPLCHHYRLTFSIVPGESNLHLNISSWEDNTLNMPVDMIYTGHGCSTYIFLTWSQGPDTVIINLRNGLHPPRIGFTSSTDTNIRNISAVSYKSHRNNNPEQCHKWCAPYDGIFFLRQAVNY